MYIFDTSSFSGMFKFYPKRFPTLWGLFNELINDDKLISVDEVYMEIQSFDQQNRIWVEKNKSIFHPPSSDEGAFIQEIFKAKNGHFQQSIGDAKLLKGGFCADPFIIASAKIKNGTVVTEEKLKPNGSKIPNICEHFQIACLNLEKFMEKENWEF